MPDYKHRWIEVSPTRHANGTWQGPYSIIEFRPTCWGYHKGCSDRIFASREEAAVAGLEEAKRIVDALEPLAQSTPRTVFGTYGSTVRRLVVWAWG